jgi:uncharacterized protein YyaL (SSP411 family)
LSAAKLDVAATTFQRDFDETNKGFGGAPKFPPLMGLEFLLRHHARTANAASLRMVDETCEAMARGGMYDQLGGGFAPLCSGRWCRPACCTVWSPSVAVCWVGTPAGSIWFRGRWIGSA